jgi:hypothetical protein
MLMYSKFDMIRRAANEQPEADGLLWVDAGLSRFFAQDLAETRVDEQYLENELGTATLAVAITPTLDLDLKHGRMARQYVGTCRRLVSGGDIYVSAASAGAMAERVFKFVEDDWLAKGFWDNEQVALGYMLLGGIPGAKIVDTTLDYASVMSRIFRPQRKPPVKRSLGTRLKRFVGIRKPTPDYR